MNKHKECCMKKYDFSVIVCCYNSDIEKLKRTLISIIKQKNVSYEIIISDDGSKERAIETIKTWIEEHGCNNVRYNFLPENVGTVKNILSAVSMAQGTYIKTISPGDYLFDEFALSHYLQKFNKGYQLLFSKAIYYTQDRKILKFYNPAATGTKYKLFMKKNVCQFSDGFLGATTAYAREFALPYLQKIVGVVRLLEDFPLTFLALLNHEKVGFINQNLVWYECDTGVSRVDGGSRIEADYFSFFNYVEQNYSNNCQAKRYVTFLRLLKKEANYKLLFKSLFIKQSYIFYIFDKILTRICRQVLYLFDKTNLSMLDKITNL